MGNTDWWAKKLAQGAPAQQPPAAPPAHHTYGVPSTVMLPQQHVQQPQQPVEPMMQPNGAYHSYDAQTGAQVADDGFVQTIVSAAAATGGSAVAKANTGQCPNCHSGNYFARNLTETGMPMRNPASPQCHDCGFPVVQAGSPTGALAGVKAKGKTTRARQLSDDHVVTVLDGNTPVSFRPPPSRAN